MTDATEWQGRVGRVWADEWRRTERAFAGIAAALDTMIRAHAPDRGRALDIGCGVGATAGALAAARPGLSVTAVDLSADLLAVARRQGGAVGYVAGDALDVAADLAPIDLFVSRHGVMFFADPAVAFAGLARAAVPGAPLVFSCFRARSENAWAAVPERALGIAAPPPPGYAPGPFAFADPAFVADLLAGAGWRDATPVAVDVEWVVGQGDDPVEDALGFFARIGPSARILADGDADARARLRGALEPYRRGGVVSFRAAAWIWTARAGDVP